MRVVVGGISHETNTFNPLPTGLEAFRIQRGKDLLEDGAVKPLLESGVDVIPTIFARRCTGKDCSRISEMFEDIYEDAIKRGVDPGWKVLRRLIWSFFTSRRADAACGRRGSPADTRVLLQEQVERSRLGLRVRKVDGDHAPLTEEAESRFRRNLRRCKDRSIDRSIHLKHVT